MISPRVKSICRAASRSTLVFACSVYAVSSFAGPIKFSGDNWNLTLTGYLRESLSINLQNQPETPWDDAGQLSMVRTQFQPQLDGNYGSVSFHLQTRSVFEVNTPYLKGLKNMGADDGRSLTIKKYNVQEIRAAYIDFNPAELTKVRLGRQQVAFGETDFFQALDLIQGFDFTYRSFLVPENEDTRKPLNMLNVIQQIPELNGAAQLVLIPGDPLNRESDYGNTYDLFGGRWANQPNKGVNFLSLGAVPYNYHAAKGDTHAFTGAIRIKGIAGNWGYSLAYLRVHNPDPVVNSVFNPFHRTPENGFAEFAFPIINAIGTTANVYSDWADAVFSTEVAYEFKAPYNVGQTAASCGAPIPGFCGVKEKDTISAMFRMDKNIDLAKKFLGASRPAFLSIQVFDKFIVSGVGGDDIVDLAGYSARKKTHSMLITGIFAWNYRNDTINPQLAGGYSVSYGGSFMIPSIQYVYGDHLRFKLEADIFFSGSGNTGNAGSGGGTFANTQNTHIFGYFSHNNQLFMRATYLF